MAPQLPEQKIEGLPTLNENFEYKGANNNNLPPQNVIGAQEKIDEIKNRRSRNLIKKCLWQLSTNLNVLVVGAKESGKSSLINSMSMSLQQTWTQCAKLSPGRSYLVEQCVLHKNSSKKQPGPTRNGKVVFYDTRGLEGIHEQEQAALMLRYILEGRINHKCVPCVLLMNHDVIKKRYHNVCDLSRRINLVLFVSDVTQPANNKLMDLMCKAMYNSKVKNVKHVPILSVATKGDQLQEASFLNLNLQQYDLNLAREKYFNKTKSFGSSASLNEESLVQILECYQCEMDHITDLPAFEINPCVKRDSGFLRIWREIITKSAKFEIPSELVDRRRAVSESVQTRNIGNSFNSCIPSFRLRINSYS